MKFNEPTGWWFPDYEEHLQEWMLKVKLQERGRLTYQRHKYLAALKYCKQRRFAIDIGGHVGLWAWQMAADFDWVNAFEPMPVHRECFQRNVLEAAGNVDLFDVAVGAECRVVNLRTRTHNSSGDTGVEPDESPAEDCVQAKMTTLDHWDFDEVDFIKIDCEGYELFVTQGATETLKRCKPCVIVEQKPETGGPERYGIGMVDAVKYLESLGAKKREAMQGDYIMSWD